MSRRPTEDPEAAAGIAQFEGYLLWQAEICTARAEGMPSPGVCHG
jgi:hypothetical protein